MHMELPKGVWPVMLTPFHDNGEIDWDGLDSLVEWYLDAGVAGLFSVCLSSEMYMLSPGERVRLAERVVKRAGGRVPVLAAGAFGDSLKQQAEAARRLAGTGLSAVVLTVNQLAGRNESDATWKRNASAIFDECGEIPLGLYECPEPYHRTLDPDLLRWAAQSGRIFFFKDTCCRRSQIAAKLEAVGGTSLSWFNAHCPTLLESLDKGGRGYSGIAANFYPELFVRLCADFAINPDKAERLQSFLTLADMTIRSRYPASAKRYLGMLGLPIGPACRIPIAPPSPGDDECAVLANLRKAVEEIAGERSGVLKCWN